MFNLTKAELQNNTITGFPSGAGIRVNMGNTNASGPGATAGIAGDSSHVISITGNKISGFSSSNELGTNAISATVSGANASSRSQGNFDISNNGTLANPLGNSTYDVIVVVANGYVDMGAKTNNNVIVGTNAPNYSGISGGTIGATGGFSSTPVLKWSIGGNTISATRGPGIFASGTGAAGTLDLQVDNNAIVPPTDGSDPGIFIGVGNGADLSRVSLEISGNNGGSHIGLYKQGSNNPFAIQGMSATATPGVKPMSTRRIRAPAERRCLPQRAGSAISRPCPRRCNSIQMAACSPMRRTIRRPARPPIRVPSFWRRA